MTKSKLADFLKQSRKTAIKRYALEREKKLLGGTIDNQDTVDKPSGDLDLIDEETKTIFSRNSFNGNQESSSMDTYDQEYENTVKVGS